MSRSMHAVAPLTERTLRGRLLPELLLRRRGLLLRLLALLPDRRGRGRGDGRGRQFRGADIAGVRPDRAGRGNARIVEWSCEAALVGSAHAAPLVDQRASGQRDARWCRASVQPELAEEGLDADEDS